LVSTSSSARLNRLASRWATPRPAQKASSSAASWGRRASSLATLSCSRSRATPRSMLEAEADTLPPARGVGRKLARHTPDDHPREPGELALIGQQLIVVRHRGRGAERLALVLGRHFEP